MVNENAQPWLGLILDIQDEIIRAYDDIKSSPINSWANGNADGRREAYENALKMLREAIDAKSTA
jgi:hypothetical protein